MSEITEHVAETPRHRSAYLQAGPQDGPLVVLVHGWPERAISWRHQLVHLAELGYRVVAPDMRGYGDSTVHPHTEDYAIEVIVGDMLDLLDALGRTAAVWVGHDWGSPVVWALAGHRPDVCTAVANLCVPYQPGGFTVDNVVALVDRDLYPQDEFPAGQWEYFLYYREQFAKATKAFEANIPNTVRVLFRGGNPATLGSRAPTAYTRLRNGWFGSSDEAPDLPMDTAVLDEASYATYVEGLTRNGFSGPDSWYLNDERNGAYAMSAVDGGRLTMPVLFLHARYDLVCETVTSRLAEPMRASCDHLTEVIVDSGHWMAQEQPEAVNAAFGRWLHATGTTV